MGILDHVRKEHLPASNAQVFTDEEVINLEQDFIDTYLTGDTSPLHILLRIYRRFWRELLISMFFYFLKTSPVLALPIVTSNIINIVTYQAQQSDVVGNLLINVGVMVGLLLLNIPTHMLYIRYHSMVVANYVYIEGFAEPAKLLLFGDYHPDPAYWQNRALPHFMVVTLITYVLLLLTALVGTYIPVRRAARTLPADALRDE